MKIKINPSINVIETAWGMYNVIVGKGSIEEIYFYNVTEERKNEIMKEYKEMYIITGTDLQNE